MNTYNFTNRLIEETSPYLLQHAHNPVDWFPWGKEAFDKAKKENKLLLISIGYSACHWCHVMERECFEDTIVANLMNELYICVKVDREEHPEVDQLYMDAVHIISGRGGWPLNCFALPNGKPVYGGTYFPKPDWEQLLLNLDKLYRNEPEKVKELCNEIEKGILSLAVLPEKKEDGHRRDFQFLDDFTEKITSVFDKTFGGYNYAPKFPMPNNYEYLLYYSYLLKNMGRADEATPIENQVYLTLEKMAMGGIYDQVGGGFARYSTDSFWKAPHFEKMLYDNAQLMSLYSNAYKCCGTELFKEVIYGIHTFISSTMTSPEGGFYSALDADSETVGTGFAPVQKEGAYYVWEKAELEQLLGDEFPLFAGYYTITEKEIWEEGKYILQRKMKDEVFCKENNISVQDLHAKREKWIVLLNAERQTRIAPGLDDKILTAWNGLMLKGYADAYKATKEPMFLEAALANARFIKSKLFTNTDGLWHTYKDGKASIPAFLDSYAFVASGFIALYEVTFDEQWLKTAKQLTDYAIEHHYDKSKNMFCFTSKQEESIMVRKLEVTDNVIPASNSEMAIVLFKSGHYFGEDEYITLSNNMLSVISDTMLNYPQGYTNWGILVLHNILHFYEVAITGKIAYTFRDKISKEYLPNMVLMGATISSGLELLKDKFVPDRTLIYICENKTCFAPLSSTGEALTAIKSLK